jgi:hypothetical protein
MICQLCQNQPCVCSHKMLLNNSLAEAFQHYQNVVIAKKLGLVKMGERKVERIGQ